MMQTPFDHEVPLGLGMALARNPAAMAAFSAMSPQERQSVIQGTHQLHSAAEMRQYVEHLTCGGL